jgi:dihydrofolate reductase
MTDKNVHLIVAVDKNNGIGKAGKLPWHFKKEMQFFKDTTSEAIHENKKNMVIMGRTTWESIDEKYRPLVDRENVVLTRNKHYKAPGATVCYSLGEAIRKADLDEGIEDIFIIGGAQIFELALPISNAMYLTRIDKAYDCDTDFPDFKEFYPRDPENLGTKEEDGVSYTFHYYTRQRETF